MNLSIGYSAIRANQIALDTIAHNIANANTPGYHRQTVQFGNRSSLEIDNLLMGFGVDANRILQSRNRIVEHALTANLSEVAEAADALGVLRQIEALFTPGPGSLHERFQTFFNELERLDASPNDTVQKEIVLRSEETLSTEFHFLVSQLTALRGDLAREIDEHVRQVNDTSRAIADLNRQIRVARARGKEANDLVDQRDQLVNGLAELVEAVPSEQGHNHPVVLLGDGSVLIGENAPVLEVSRDDAGRIAVTQAGWDKTVRLDSGRVGALLSAHNDVVTDFLGSLDVLATSLMGAVDGVQATGLGAAGGFDVLQGQRFLSDSTLPLADLDSAFAIQSGQLFVSITDSATGERRTASINIDPATDSLEDIAAALSGIDHLQAIADPEVGSLTILAEPGYTFDFAGRLETSPDTSTVTGTTQPRLHGTYTGDHNDRFSFEAVGSGTIGVTDGLRVVVRNADNQVVATLDVGQTYEPGTELEIADGVHISFDSGTLNAGDSFSTPVIASSDTAGILTALGLNTFFTGTSATDISVNPFLVENSDRLATSLSGMPGETSNLQRLLDLRDEPLLNQNTRTFEQYLAALTADIGGRVQVMSSVHENLSLLNENLVAQRESYSGVDPNEEMVHLLQFQRAFQAAANLVETSDEMVQELLRVVD